MINEVLSIYCSIFSALSEYDLDSNPSNREATEIIVPLQIARDFSMLLKRYNIFSYFLKSWI